MLESHAYHRHGREGRFLTHVRETEDLPDVLQFWMAHMARDLLRLGVFFRAAALMCQIPGGARYRYVPHDDHDDDLPDDDERTLTPSQHLVESLELGELHLTRGMLGRGPQC